jgi:glucose/arabinose dehydrogenase
MKLRTLHALSLSVAAAALVLPARLLAAPADGEDANKTFGVKVFAEGFVSPTTLIPLPGSDGSLLVADQPGVLYLVSKDGKRAETPFLDLRPRMIKTNHGFDERGLLSVALHPKFAENRKFYVTYSAPKRPMTPEDWDNTLTLAEFTANADGLTAIDGSHRVVLQVDKPYFNHNGGCLQFGPDGYLYMSTGDGGNGSDQGKRPPTGNGQNLQTLLGKILRIDVDGHKPYGIPKDNPFVGKSARPEIYAYGMRNPWRISFDAGGEHQLFAGDVGQDAYEEVDIIVKGGNYGWNVREGFHCFNPKDTIHAPEDCPKTAANGDPFIDPILEYKNFKAHPNDPDAQGISITGGFVYRGSAIPWLEGKYLFADWSRVFVKPDGVLFAATKASDGKWSWRRITPSTHPDGMKCFITGFGQDANHELYIFTNESNGLVGTTGKVQKIVPM